MLRGAFRRAEELLLQRRGSEVYLETIGIITENNRGIHFELADSDFARCPNSIVDGGRNGR